jgi:hypothetical protein
MTVTKKHPPKKQSSVGVLFMAAVVKARENRQDAGLTVYSLALRSQINRSIRKTQRFFRSVLSV